MTERQNVETNDGGRQAVINGPERFKIEEPMQETTTATAGGGRPLRRCMPWRCTRYTIALIAFSVLSLVLATLLIVCAVRLYLQPTCDPDDNSGSARPALQPSKLYSDFADDGTPLPWTDIRLPRSVVPESYALQLRVDPSQDWFHGSVDIYVRIDGSTQVIVLHASSLDVGDVDNVRITHKVIRE